MAVTSSEVVRKLIARGCKRTRQLVRERDELVHTGTVRREVVQPRMRTLPLQPSANGNVQPKARAACAGSSTRASLAA
jgi:hypothetical protein